MIKLTLAANGEPLLIDWYEIKRIEGQAPDFKARSAVIVADARLLVVETPDEIAAIHEADEEAQEEKHAASRRARKEAGDIKDTVSLSELRLD